MDENSENVQPQPSESPVEQPATCPEKVEDKNVCNIAMLCHLLGIFTCIVGPLIIWLVKKDSSEFIDEHGKAYLNWQISVLIYAIVSTLLVVIVIGGIMLLVLGVLNLIFCVIAALKASDGKPYNYPLAIKFLK